MSLAVTCKCGHDAYRRFERRAVMRVAGVQGLLSEHKTVQPGMVLRYTTHKSYDFNIAMNGYYQVTSVTSTSIRLMRLTKAVSWLNQSFGFRKKYFELKLGLVTVEQGIDDAVMESQHGSYYQEPNTAVLRKLVITNEFPDKFHNDALSTNWRWVATDYDSFLPLWRKHCHDAQLTTKSMSQWGNYNKAQRRRMRFYVTAEFPATDESLLVDDFSCGMMQVPPCPYKR